MRRGILAKPHGRKREQLEAWFASKSGPHNLFAGRILPFDERAALVWAQLMTTSRALGQPRNELDAMIAAIAESNRCVVVTDNERDFAGIAFVNPLRAAT